MPAFYDPNTDPPVELLDSEGNPRSGGINVTMAGDPNRRPELGDYDEGSWQRNRRAWERDLAKWEDRQLGMLEGEAPSVDDLSYDVDHERGDFSLGDSAAGAALADEAAIDSQRQALRQLEDIYRQGGYTDAERAQIDQSMMQARAMEQAQAAAARQQAAARGMTGSGAQLAAQLSAQQGAMNRGRTAAMDIATQGQRRALQALQGAGEMASGMREQSFDEGFKRGSAIDEFTADDTQYRRDREQRRAEAETAARKHRTEATQQRFENLADIKKSRVDASQGSRGLMNQTEGRVDSGSAAQRSAISDPIETGIDIGAKAFGA